MPGAGFGQQEVMQVATVQGRPVLLFSCLHGALSQQRRAARMRGGIWSAPAASFLGPFDVAAANIGTDGRFIGEITDPMPVTWSATDQLTLISPQPT
jgi:hypothetical protein